MSKKLASSLSKNGLVKTAEYVNSKPEGEDITFCSINSVLKDIVWPLVKKSETDKNSMKIVANILPHFYYNELVPEYVNPVSFKVAAPKSNLNKYASMVQELVFDGPFPERLVKIAAYVPAGEGNTSLNISRDGVSRDISLMWVPESWYKDFVGEDFSRNNLRKADKAVDGMVKLAAPNMQMGLGGQFNANAVGANPILNPGLRGKGLLDYQMPGRQNILNINGRPATQIGGNPIPSVNPAAAGAEGASGELSWAGKAGRWLGKNVGKPINNLWQRVRGGGGVGGTSAAGEGAAGAGGGGAAGGGAGAAEAGAGGGGAAGGGMNTILNTVKAKAWQAARVGGPAAAEYAVNQLIESYRASKQISDSQAQWLKGTALTGIGTAAVMSGNIPGAIGAVGGAIGSEYKAVQKAKAGADASGQSLQGLQDLQQRISLDRKAIGQFDKEIEQARMSGDTASVSRLQAQKLQAMQDAARGRMDYYGNPAKGAGPGGPADIAGYQQAYGLG